MYQKPALIRVGAAEDVILGFGVMGNDLDMTYVPPGGGEWGDDDLPLISE